MKAINLLPTDLRGAAKTAPKAKAAGPSDEPGGIAAFVVLGALAACVAALAVYVLTTNTVKDRQAQLDAVTAEATTANQRVAELKPYADFQQMAETRIQTVKDLATSRFDWEQAMRDISRVVPGAVCAGLADLLRLTRVTPSTLRSRDSSVATLFCDVVQP